MPSQTALLVAVAAILVLMIVARLALNGQVRQARARAEGQERLRRAGDEGDPDP